MRPGILDMVGATLTFVLMVACVKWAGDATPTMELVFWRGFLGGLATLPALRRTGLRVTRWDVLLVRTGLGFLAMTCFFTAAQHLSLAEVELISKVQPVLVAVGAPLLYGAAERPGGAVWSALGIGVLGAALLVAPGAVQGSAYGLWAVGAAVFAAGAHLTLRFLGRTESPRVVVFWFQMGSAALAWGVASWQAGAPMGLPETSAWPAILAIAAFATWGQLLMTRAYQREPAAAVAATSYTGPLFAVLGDLLLFAVWPGWNAWVGGPLVLLAGLMLLLGGVPTPARIRAAWRSGW